VYSRVGRLCVVVPPTGRPGCLTMRRRHDLSMMVQNSPSGFSINNKGPIPFGIEPFALEGAHQLSTPHASGFRVRTQCFVWRFLKHLHPIRRTHRRVLGKPPICHYRGPSQNKKADPFAGVAPSMYQIAHLRSSIWESRRLDSFRMVVLEFFQRARS